MAMSLWPQISRKSCVGLWLACLGGCLWSAKPAYAQAFLEKLQFVGIEEGGLSSLARSLKGGTGGLSDGSRYSFDRYYSTDIPDLRFTMLSPVNSNLGVLWGFGTGESGEKYQIEPSLKVGFLYMDPLGENAWYSLSVTTVLWGYFHEKPCTADYGAVGGVQAVNCRMADSTMPPADTLEYLENRAPTDQLSVSFRYRIQF